jgi:hypothetical protein
MFVRVRRRRHKLLGLCGIPGPRPRLFDGSMQLYLHKKCSYLEDVKLQQKYGRVYGVYIGDEPNVTITDLELLRKIFFEKMSSFKDRNVLFVDSPVAKSILFARYDRWKLVRRAISPAFNSICVGSEEAANFIDNIIKLMLDYIENKLATQTTPRVSINIYCLMKATSLRLITGLAVDMPVEISEDDPYVNSLDCFLAKSDHGGVLVAIVLPFLKGLISTFVAHLEHGITMDLVRREINRQIDDGLKSLANNNNNNRRDKSMKVSLGCGESKIMNILIRMHHKGQLTREEVVGNAEAMLFAGYDTTSVTLGYLFWTLGKHLDIQEKLRSELMAHGVESKYLEQVINESMRLYPTLLSFVTRIATENVTIGQWTLPSGTKVVYNSWLMSRDPDYWPEPDKFDPERFREGAQIHPCAFAPFGFNEKKCLGYYLAQHEIKTIVCDIICRYRIYTKAPDNLVVHACAQFLTAPNDKIIVDLERL